MNLPFVIVHFNTPELTACLCSSIRKYYQTNEIIIFDNSTIKQFPKDLIDVFDITYIDNTTNKILNFEQLFSKYKKDPRIVKQNNLGSANHCITIDFLIKYINTNFILLDSDVLLKTQIDFIDEKYITIGALSSDERKLNLNRQLRIFPFLQYFNVTKIKQYNISYFNSSEIVGIDSQKQIYDTGASFYKTLCISHANEIKSNVNIYKYIVHLNSGSWSHSQYKSWLLTHKALWQ